LTLPDNITNTDNITASVRVTVANQPEPAVQENPADATAQIIQQTTAGLLNNVWNFIRGIFTSIMGKAASLPAIQTATAGLMNGVNFLKNGVVGRIINLFK
jgi:hypothetical protein